MREKLTAARCTTAALALSAGTAVAGEITGAGTPTGPTHANSISKRG